MTSSSQIVAIGECMIEMSPGSEGQWRLGVAGDTLNTLWYARSHLDPDLGALDYFTALGDDSFSDRIVAFLDANGIATDNIARLSGRRPGLYFIEQHNGDRRFAYWRDASAARRLAEDEARLRCALENARAIYLSGISLAILPPEGREALLRALEAVRSKGRIIAFDPNIRPILWESMDAARETVMQAAALATIVLPSFDDEAACFGDADPRETTRRYRRAGCLEVAVKNGQQPVTVLADEVVTSVEVAVVDKPVDATAAGDSFNGAYLATRLTGGAPNEAARAGCRMAEKVVAHHGALIRMPGMERWERPPADL